jgi:ABC-type nitrate/sulfonate/bicarbonate transport system substrate-binding protein
MERGDFDVVWIFDGWDKLRLEQAGVEVTTIPFIEHTDCIPDWYTPLIATSSALAEDDPELVAAFLEATARGYQAAIDDPTAAADALLAAAPELDERLVYASAEYLADQFQADAEQWGVQSERVWSEFVEFLLTAGLIESSPSMADAYTNKFLPDS